MRRLVLALSITAPLSACSLINVTAQFGDPDAGMTDAGPDDAGTTDSGIDAGTDSGLPDAGTCSLDRDSDGYVSTECGGDDCNDLIGSVHPTAPETCNDSDDDCDSDIDEGLSVVCYEDLDHDGYASGGASMMTASCECPSGWTPTVPSAGNRDCLATNADVHPGQSEFFSRPACPSECSDVIFISPVGWSCVDCMALPTFDYDCDGTLEPEPTHVSCFMTGIGCISDSDCMGAGPENMGTPSSCGRNVSYIECTCSSNCERSTTSARLSCR